MFGMTLCRCVGALGLGEGKLTGFFTDRLPSPFCLSLSALDKAQLACEPLRMKFQKLLLLSFLFLGLGSAPVFAKKNQLTALDQPINLSGKLEFRTIGTKQWVLADASAATLMIWMKPAAFAGREQHLVSVSIGGGNAGWASRAALAIRPDGGLRAWGRPIDSKKDSVEANGPAGSIRPDQWSHVAVVIDFQGNSMRFYVNGELAGEPIQVHFSKPKTPHTPSDTITVGAEDDGSGYFFHGSLAKLGIFSRALSSEEIRSYAKHQPEDRHHKAD